jgi:hypothetical protein
LVRSAELAQAAELVADVAGIDAILGEHPRVLGFVGVDLAG